jgi:hypothetical protein
VSVIRQPRTRNRGVVVVVVAPEDRGAVDAGHAAACPGSVLACCIGVEQELRERGRVEGGGDAGAEGDTEGCAILGLLVRFGRV